MGKYKAAGTDKIEIESGKSEGQINKLFGKLTGIVTQIYVLFCLCVFPLCMNDKYFDILKFRFSIYWKATLAFGIVCLVTGLVYLLADALYNKGAIRRRFFADMKNGGSSNGDGDNALEHKRGSGKARFGKIRNAIVFRHLSSTDIAFTALIVVCSLATAFAEYPYEAFWGDRGRYQGLLLWLVFYLAYWLITRFYSFKKWHIYAFLLSSCAVLIWGICNFFLVTFGMFEGTLDNYKYTFVSSIGNINTYCNFTGIVLGVSAAVFISEKKALNTIFAYIVLCIACFAHIMGLCDNALLSLGMILAASPLIFWKELRDVWRYFAVMLTYCSAMKITSLITESGIPTMNDPEPSIQIVLAGKGFFMVVLLTLVILTLGSFVFALKKTVRNTDPEVTDEKTGSDHDCVKKLKKIWIGLLALGMILVLIILLLANTGWNESLWEPYKNFLIFNDKWGTGRGLNWRLGMEYWFNDAGLFAKLFGYGPDTYYIIMMDRYKSAMRAAGYGFFDSAHNEYLEYFITIGLLGLIAYISMILSALKKMLENHENVVKAIALGVMAYACQAVVNIAIPVTTPVLMTLLFVGVAARKAEKV